MRSLKPRIWLSRTASAPSAPRKGQKYYNTTSNIEFAWNGTAWRPTDAAGLTDGSIGTAALAVNPLARANHTGTQVAGTISDLPATVKGYSLDMFVAPVAAVSWGTQKLTNLATGTLATDGINLGQMTAAITAAVAGQTAVKNPVRVLATANLALTGLQTVDGVTLVAGDRILLSGQTTASQNNIYVAASGAWALATDCATTGQLVEGTDVLVNEGTLFTGTIWRVTTIGTITIGTTSIVWTQTAKINTYTADGITLNLTGFQFSIKIDAAGWLTSSASGLAIDKTKVTMKFSGTITGDGTTTSFPFTHNTNNSNPIVSIRDSTGAKVMVDETATSANVITVMFSVAPLSAVTYSVSIQG